MNLKKHLPNSLTCANLICGCLGLLSCASGRLDMAFYMTGLAAVFDFFDGFAARLLKVSSPIGKDLDSLADMVTFGVLPGFVMYSILGLIQCQENRTEMINTYFLFTNPLNSPGDYLPFIALLIPVFSAIRLAKFNNDKRQSNSFIGVPTPANALLIGSLGFLLIEKLNQQGDISNNYELVFNSTVMPVLTMVMSYLLVAELPLFALKFKKFSWKANRLRYTFLIISGGLLIVFRFEAIPFIIFLYILLSIMHNVINRNKNIQTGN